jgi:uncharacterized SAM-binding protein YcdF (DUF218 family)
MFFEASRALGFFAEPSNILITLGLVGAVLLLTPLALAGRRMLVGATVLLAICGLTPAGTMLLAALENRFPAWEHSNGAPDGIVVLGGAIEEIISAAHGEVALNESAERMTAAVDLARRYPRARLVFSGGSKGFAIAEAIFARRLFDRLGVEPARVELEERSRNTVENATFSKLIAAPKPGERWLLVTSAFHMPRAIGAFRHAGFFAEPYPVDWRTRGPSEPLRPGRSLSDGLRRMDNAVREWFGLLAYWLAGHTSELFPGPATQVGCDTATAREGCRR